MADPTVFAGPGGATFDAGMRTWLASPVNNPGTYNYNMLPPMQRAWVDAWHSANPTTTTTPVTTNPVTDPNGILHVPDQPVVLPTYTQIGLPTPAPVTQPGYNTPIGPAPPGGIDYGNYGHPAAAYAGGNTGHPNAGAHLAETGLGLAPPIYTSPWQRPPGGVPADNIGHPVAGVNPWPRGATSVPPSGYAPYPAAARFGSPPPPGPGVANHHPYDPNDYLPAAAPAGHYPGRGRAPARTVRPPGVYYGHHPTAYV